MEDPSSSQSVSDRALAEMTQSLSEGRTRARQSLAEQRKRLREMEAEVTRQLDRVNTELRADREDLETERESLREQAALVEQRQTQLLADQEEWERLQEEETARQQALAEFLQTKQDELDQRENALDEEESQLRNVQKTLEASQVELDDQIDQLSQVRKRVDEKLSTLDQERETVEQRAQETKSQRRRVARQLKEQKNEQQHKLDQDRAEHEKVVALFQQEQTAWELEKAEFEQARVEAASEQADATLKKKLAEAEQKFHVASDEARNLRRYNSELEEKLHQRPEGPSAVEQARLERLEEERDTLYKRLEDAEAKARKGSAPADVQQKLQDLQRRFEMAVEDLREQKTENADLTRQLKAARTSDPTTEPPNGNLDWEARKKKLLASLEMEFDEDDEEDRRERMSIEGTIEITDEVVAEKQREVDELKQLLEEQSSQLGGMAVGAAAIAATLDQDELIVQERQRLEEIQLEWKEKLRQAEIDISVDRAKIARERAALEEQLAQANEMRKAAPTQPSGKTEEKGKKSSGGNWLTRLGLKDSGDENA